jgi:hypothetical protein
MIGAVMMAMLASAPISIDYRGTLGESLNAIATKGGINLIATGNLHVPAEVHLKDVTAEEALQALAKVHHLELTHEGALWIVKPAEVAPAPARSAIPPVPAVAPVAPVAPVALIPALGATPEEIEKEAEAAQERAEQAQERAEALRDEAERIRDAKEEAAEAAEDEQSARVDEAKAAVEQAKASAKEVKSGKRVTTGSIVIPDGEHVQDIVSYGGSVTLGDHVEADGSVVAFGGDVVLGRDTSVNGDAVSFGGSVKKAPGAKVKGEEVAFGGSGLAVRSMARSLPTVTSMDSGTTTGGAKAIAKGSSGLAGFLINFATFFGLGFLLMMFAPNRMRNIEAEILKEPVKSGLAGLLALFGVIPLSLLLFLTLVGIPFMLLMWIAAGIAMLMGLLALANSLGERVPLKRLRRTQAAVLAIGLLALMLVALVPVIGPLLLSAACCVSFGAIIRTRVGQRALTVPIADDKFIHDVGAGA